LEKNIAAIGGLETYSSLNSLNSFNAQDTAVFFPDNLLTDFFQDHPGSFGYLLIGKSSLSPIEYELMFPLVNEDNIIQTIDATNHSNPSKTWSKASTLDPDNGQFHPFLNSLGIENWEFDYGKGLVITHAMGEKISMPVQIPKDGEFDFFIRYLENQKGGIIKTYVDDKPISELDTQDDRDSRFLWKKLSNSSSPLYLTKGKHTLTLENVAGFNAVNIIAVLPAELTKHHQYESKKFANNMNNIYLLEAESDFYSANGIKNTSSIPSYSLLRYGDFDPPSNNINNTYGVNDRLNKTASGQFVAPPDSNLLSLRLSAEAGAVADNDKQLDKTSDSYVLINDLEIIPSYPAINIVSSDFERNKESVPLGTLRHQDWINHNEENLFTSLEIQKPISGNTSLRIDVKETNATSWSVISTDFFPINDKAYYKFSSDISARGVNQLHSKVVYYDANKERINSQFMSEGRDGNFDDTVSHSVLPPLGSKYLRFEFLGLPKTAGNYLIDDVHFEQVEPNKSQLGSDFGAFEHLNHSSNQHREQGKSDVHQNNDYSEGAPLLLDFHSKSGKIYDTTSLQTRPVHVMAGSKYNYTISVEGKNLDSFSAVASFGNNSNIIENSTRYGRQASAGSVLSLSPGSEVYTDLNVLKQANYSIAVRAGSCESCSIRWEIKDIEEDNDVISTNVRSLSNDNDANNYNNNKSKTREHLKWLYLANNVWLDEGNYEFRISSDSKVDLDLVMILQNQENGARNDTDGARSPEGIFNVSQFSATDTPAASISEYKKINPTKYEVKISNAIRPYVLSFAESYDPLWLAYTRDNNKHVYEFKNVPLYSIINGFLIDKTGDYNLTIEYQPQKWFMIGATVSVITILSVLIFIVSKKLFRTKIDRRIYGTYTKSETQIFRK
jgi:hypothetical protein